MGEVMTETLDLPSFLHKKGLSIVKYQPAVEDPVSYYIPLESRGARTIPAIELQKLEDEVQKNLEENGIKGRPDNNGALKIMIERPQDIVKINTDLIDDLREKKVIQEIEPWLNRTVHTTSWADGENVTQVKWTR
jgi:hypothetical protein